VDQLEQVRAAKDPLTRVKLVTEALATYQSAVTELGNIRKAAIQELRLQGLSLTEIAEQAGISRGRLSQLGVSGPAPERSVLSAGTNVIVCVPVEAAAFPDGTKRAVVHKEDADFIDKISGLAKRLNLTTTTEYVGAGEFIDFNRDGLVVTCGPRQSPWLEQLLSADNKYGFAKDDQGWHLENKESGAIYRSPQDSGQPGDYAYLGVLPRPDGQGTWLYAAGIHAAGSRGAAQYLSEHIEEIHRDTKGYLWSALVSCTFDSSTRAITTTELLEPIQRRGSRRK
jgi:hypothetical protein